MIQKSLQNTFRIQFRFLTVIAIASFSILFSAFIPPSKSIPTGTISQDLVTNVALNKPTTCGSYQSGYESSFANDNDGTNNSYWQAKPYPQWWKVDLGALYDLTSIVIRNYVQGSSYFQYSIQVSSDDITYTQVASKVNRNRATDAGDTYPVSTVARYIRVNMTYSSRSMAVQISDFRAYGTPTAGLPTYTINSSCGPNGSISPLGTVSVSQNSSYVFFITPENGYQIEDVLVDGSSVGPVTSYTFPDVTSNHTISATFSEISTYVITARTDGNGIITPADEVVVPQNGSQTFTIVPNEGFQLAEVYVDGELIPVVSTYTFTDVTTDHSISAFFEPVYVITARTDGNGTITPADEVIVPQNGSQTFTIVPNEGFQLAEVYVDGELIPVVSVYTFTDVTADHSIAAFFVPFYVITARTDGNGTITPADEVTVPQNGNQTFIITPNEGFQISEVYIDGELIPAVSTYTFTDVTADHSIAAFFVPFYVITARTDGNGTITPADEVIVPQNGNQTFIITPNEGFQIAEVYIDGELIPVVSTYTFTDVIEGHTIEAFFVLILTPGVIGDSQSICYNTIPTPLTQITAPGGGTGEYTYQWQSSPDNSIWTDISGATLPGYSPGALTVDTWYRRFVSDAAGRALASDSIKITVYPNLTAGTIGSDQTIYSGTLPSALTETMPASGGSGSYAYQWQHSTDGVSWSSISGANSSGYSPQPISLNTYFRRHTSDGCGSVAGNSVLISTRNITLYTNEIPVSGGADNLSLGTEFELLSDGFISKVRLYTNNQEIGDHYVRIWLKVDENVYTTIAGPYTWGFTNFYTGWREYTLPMPVQVYSGHNYVVSITTPYNNDQYVQSEEYFQTNEVNAYITYIRGLYTTDINDVPRYTYMGTSYFRDVVFNLFSPGVAGSNQSICYSNVPAPLNETSLPFGGDGVYTYQWQSSSDNTNWSNILGSVSPSFSPPALTSTTYYRRAVTSGNLTAYTSSVCINVSPEFDIAQLHDDVTIYSGTTTNISVTLTGGTAPFTINYSRNGVPQDPVTGYHSGAGISTGNLTTGSYVYTLTSVTDANGCNPQSLGTGITITVSGSYTPISTSKALIMVNGTSAYYSDFTNLIQPYLDNFGIPYDIFNSNTPTGHPAFSGYAVIIFGHRDVYSGVTPSVYPVTDLYAALNAGIGLYSFDPKLFNYTTGTLSGTVSLPLVNSGKINIGNTTHYISRNHASDAYNLPINVAGDLYSNNYDVITLRTNMSVSQSSSLISGTNIATMTEGSNNVSLLEVSAFNSGRVVKWNSYGWASESILGPVYGMDDLIWRGIVWAARKPFVIKGLPAFVTMRVDDVNGYGTGVQNNFEWIGICNDYSLIPWCGTFTVPSQYIPTLKHYLDNDLATASPHAFNYENSIFFNHNSESGFDPVANTLAAQAFYTSNGLKMSKYLLPHYYEIDPVTVQAVSNMGIEFLGTHMALGTRWGSFWLDIAPYRIPDGYMGRSSDVMPVYYADNLQVGSNSLFICVTEIRDDAGYEWVPKNLTVPVSVGQGVRQVTRGLNSMALSTLFSHQDQFEMSSQHSGP